MMIVAKAAQGTGLGRTLMEEMISRLSGCTVILQATENGLPLYRKLGFKDAGTLHQHQGTAPDVPPVALHSHEALVPLTSSDIGIADHYSEASGSDKRLVVGKLLSEDRGVMLTRDGIPFGFAMLRRFGRGWCIAPVVAADIDVAKVLIRYWLQENKGTFTRIDVVGGTSLSDWVEKIGLPNVDVARTMALGPLPKTSEDFTVFAVTAQALG